MKCTFYSTPVRLYGGVPVLTHQLELNETIPTRNTDKIIIQELDKAAQKLPPKRTSRDEIGCTTKGALTQNTGY